MKATMNGDDIFSIRIVTKGKYLLQDLNNLVEGGRDFVEDKETGEWQ